MRTIIADQFEFPDPYGEERVEISIASISDFPFPTLEKFVASSLGGELAKQLNDPFPAYPIGAKMREQVAEMRAPKPFDEIAGSQVRLHLLRFAGIQLPVPCNWPTQRLSDEEGDWHFVISSPDSFISYSWSSSA